MQFSAIVLIANLVSTCFMVGLIWMTQVVHYPLFAKVGREEFVAYEANHQSLTSLVVGPPMLLEFLTALLLVWFRPANVSSGVVYTALALLVIIWASTAFIQVPCHEKLKDGFDPLVHAQLVNSNWIRTIGWSVRGALVISMFASSWGSGPR